MREVRWPTQVVDLDLKPLPSLQIQHYQVTSIWLALPKCTNWIQGLISCPNFRFQFSFSPPEANHRNLVKTPSPVPVLSCVQSFPVCPASSQLFGVGKAIYFPASIVNRWSRNIDNSVKLWAACPSRASTWYISMYSKIYPWNLSKHEFLILIQNEY